MHITTRAQREALFRVFQREFPGWISPGWRLNYNGPGKVRVPLIQYLRFRRKAFIAFGNCVMIPWGSMILGIERDGYTHS